jgi:hypothetical protein
MPTLWAAAAASRILGPWDPFADQVDERPKLDADKLFQVDAFPIALDEEVLIGGQRLNAGGKARDEFRRIRGGGPVDCTTLSIFFWCGG